LVGIQHNVVDIKHVAMQLVAVVIRVVHRAVLRVAIRHVVEAKHVAVQLVAVIRVVHRAVFGVAIRHVVERFHPPKKNQLSIVSC